MLTRTDIYWRLSSAECHNSVALDVNCSDTRKNLSAPAPDQKILIKFYGNFDKQRFLNRKKLQAIETE